MSTRANYRIDGVLFYIHHDGYPEGAADYFNDAIIENNGRLTAGAFMRTNNGCEFSGGLHSDIEYFYNYNSPGDILKAYKVDFEGERTLFFEGSIYDFINEHIKTDWIDDKDFKYSSDSEKEERLKVFNEYKEIKQGFRERTINKAILNREATEQLKEFLRYSKIYKEDNPNIKASLKRLQETLDLIVNF